MDTKEIEVHVDKDNKIDFKEFIEMKIKYDEEYFKKDKEIERLNNVIDKFEKWLDTVPNYFMSIRSNNTGVYVQKGMQQMIDMSKKKLQELKGSDKE